MTNPLVMPRRSDLRSDKKGANRSQFSGLHNQLPSIRRNMLETAGSIPYDEAQVQLVGRRPDEQRVLPQSESALASAWLQDAANRSNCRN